MDDPPPLASPVDALAPVDAPPLAAVEPWPGLTALSFFEQATAIDTTTAPAKTLEDRRSATKLT